MGFGRGETHHLCIAPGAEVALRLQRASHWEMGIDGASSRHDEGEAGEVCGSEMVVEVAGAYRNFEFRHGTGSPLLRPNALPRDRRRYGAWGRLPQSFSHLTNDGPKLIHAEGIDHGREVVYWNHSRLQRTCTAIDA